MYFVDIFDQSMRRRGRLPIYAGSVVLRRNGVGTFSLNLLNSPGMRRLEHGWHVVIMSDDGRQVMSGMPDQHTVESNAGVTVTTISGRSHMAWLADTITLPSPASPVESQSDAAYWKDSGKADQVIRRLIESHIGAKAHVSRRRPIRFSSVDNVGPVKKFETRFKPLLDEVKSLAGDDLVVSAALENGRISFNVYASTDRRRRVRLSEAGGGVTGYKLEQKAPTATEVLVAGQGQGKDRQIKHITGNRSDWGVSALVFQDRRDTEDVEELVKAGTETLAEAQEQASITVETAAQAGRRFLRDFTVGDTITVSLRDGVEIVDIVQSAQIDWADKGETVKLQVGPVAEELGAPEWVKRVNRLRAQLRAVTAI